jgi:hypothetical protein
MLDEHVTRLSEPYSQQPQPDEHSLLRLAGPLGLDLAAAVELGDEIVSDLDTTAYGIGWWKAYQELDRQTRILLSDYLVACARAIPDNLVEAQVERLELDHAARDFSQWMARGLTSAGRGTVEAPCSPYEDLASHRVQSHLAGALRAWGSALDCVEGCIIGVAGLPVDLVKADMKKARDHLRRQASESQALKQLQADLEQAEAAAGPAGWREWLLGMRNTFVHRGRRTNFWVGDIDDGTAGRLSLRLPLAPGLTDVDAIVQATGLIAATFPVPATDLLGEVSKTVGAFVAETCRILAHLWRVRRADPGLLAQSSKQWKQPEALLIELPAFRGYPSLAQPRGVSTSLGLSPEGARRLGAAALLHPLDNDRGPDPAIWT